MKKILLSLILSLSISFGFATNVSGGIYSNTTWTLANSPYIVTDTVKVFSGYTLTIQPGVVVKFNTNGLLINAGTLIANGTPSDSIIFTSNSSSPTAGIWNGIQNGTSFSYCRVSYSAWGISVSSSRVSHCLFNNNTWGIYSLAYPVDSCVFSYNTNGLRLGTIITGCSFLHNGQATTGTGSILHCNFSNNNTGVGSTINAEVIAYCKFDSNNQALQGGADTLRNCTITNNQTGVDASGYITLNTITNNNIGIANASTVVFNIISNNVIGIQTADGNISCNSICNNSSYNIVQTDNLNSNIRNNYWCLTDSAQIQATIYDGYQNINLSIDHFMPFDTAPCASTPASCGLNLTATASSYTVCTSGGTTTLMAHIIDDSSYTINWTPGNYTGANYTVSPTTNVTYKVVVSDSKGCKDSATVTIDTVNCSSSSCNLIIWAGAGSTNLSSCTSTTLTDTTIDSNTITSVTWNPGNYSGNSYTVSPATTTTYTVTATDNKGCTNSAIVVINVAGSLVTPSICYVTADTTSQHNEIVWSKVGLDTNAIDSVIIFREVTTNNYMRVGASSIHGYSEYTDLTSNPNNESYYYEIEVKDTCGSSSLSNPAETILLQSMKGLGSAVDLSWNLYSGNAVNDYRILRDDSGTGNWHIIDSVPGNVGAYTDSHAPTSPGLRYMLNTSWSLSCTPYLPVMPHKNAYHYKFDTKNESYSNITNVIISGINQLISSTDINIYPNPVKDELSISMHEAFDGTATITNVLGQAVYTTKLTANGGSTQTLSMSNLASGVYFLKLESNGQVITKKVIKL